MSRPIGILIVLTLVGCLFAACGSSPSAAQQVCSDRSDLTSAVSTVVSDLRAGNFTKAKDDLPAVRDAFNNLKSSAKNLATEQRQALAPQIDALGSTVGNLRNSTSISELTTGFASVRSQVESISSEIASTLNCS